MKQFELFASPPQAQAAMPTAESVRLRLEAILHQLKGGSAHTWPLSKREYLRVVFPQMCEWLPMDERDLKIDEFIKLISENHYYDHDSA